MDLLSFASSHLPDSAGDVGWPVLALAALWQIKRAAKAVADLARKLSTHLDGVDKDRSAADEHRRAEALHWAAVRDHQDREEAILRQLAGGETN